MPRLRSALAALRPALTTAALLALLGLGGWALYATGWEAGYDAALEDAFDNGHVEEIGS